MATIAVNLQAVSRRIARRACGARDAPTRVHAARGSKTLPAHGSGGAAAPASALSARTTCRKRVEKIDGARRARRSSGTSSGRCRATRRAPVAERFDWVHIDRARKDRRAAVRAAPGAAAAAQRADPGQRERRGPRAASPRRGALRSRDAVAAAAAPAAARADGDSRADGRLALQRARFARLRELFERFAPTGSRSTRCRWACATTSRRRSPRARRWCASAPRSSVHGRASGQ